MHESETWIPDMMDAISRVQSPRIEGTIIASNERFIEAVLPETELGSICSSGDQLLRVMEMSGERIRAVPLQSGSVRVGDRLSVVQRIPAVYCGEGLVGRIVDPLCRPLDGAGKLSRVERWPVRREPPNPLTRLPVQQQLETGFRVLDGLLPIGKGQRTGLFAGPGQGKSTLLADLVKRSRVDVAVVCLVGERGREVGEFVHARMNTAGRDRCTVILATSDTPPAKRIMALETATAISEWHRDQGKDVLLIVDSLTRVVRAKRELDLALGQMVDTSGFTASSFSFLPNLLERAGPSEKGTITAIYAVLTESTPTDPVGHEVQSLLDGHLVLSAKRADAGKWPALDVVASISRVMRSVIDEKQLQAAATVRAVLAAAAENEDLFLIGAYRSGASPPTDAYVRHRETIERFLMQPGEEYSPLSETRSQLITLAERLRHR
jgi:flagellum-specific ATP synthase